MSDGTWRPLGVETEGDIAQYDALREGVPDGMHTTFWEWIQAGFTARTMHSDRSGSYNAIDAALAEHAAQALGVDMGTVRHDGYTTSGGYSRAYQLNLDGLMPAMGLVPQPLVIADFLLAHSEHADPEVLDLMLKRSRSAWTVGERDGHAGLVRRVPEAVGDQVDLVVRTAGSAGTKLKAAWEAVYGIQPNASHAYSMAIRAVEDVAIPTVVPNQTNATLGHVIGQMRNDGDWRLAFTREPDSSPIGGVPLAMAQALWNGQHDRHGGVPTAPGSVSAEEAEAAVSLAVSLVHWFSSGIVARRAHAS